MKTAMCYIHARVNCPDQACARILIVKEMLDHIWILQGLTSSYDGKKWSKQFKARLVVLVKELEDNCRIEANKLGSHFTMEPWIP